MHNFTLPYIQCALQNGTHWGKRGVAEQSVRGRMGLGTVSKDEPSRMKNISIGIYGKEGTCIGLRKIENSQKKTFNYVYICLSHLLT
jgi:hypothetical protein